MAEETFSIQPGEIFLYKGEPREYYLVTRIEVPQVTLVDAFGVESPAEAVLAEGRVDLVGINGVSISPEMCERHEVQEVPSIFNMKFRELIHEKNLD